MLDTVLPQSVDNLPGADVHQRNAAEMVDPTVMVRQMVDVF